MQPRPTYYTDDITLMPLGAIWRMLRQASGLSRVLVFIYFVLRKVLRSRLPANYAAARPDLLPRITLDAEGLDDVSGQQGLLKLEKYSKPSSERPPFMRKAAPQRSQL